MQTIQMLGKIIDGFRELRSVNFGNQKMVSIFEAKVTSVNIDHLVG